MTVRSKHSPGPAIAVRAKARVGEGPVWVDDHLLWVDLVAGRLHRSDVRTGKDDVVEVGGILGAVVPTDSSRLAAITDEGFAVIDQDAICLLAAVTPQPDQRMNDGKCDQHGRFWAGSATYDFREGEGALHVWDEDGGARQVLEGVTLPNGLGWSPDSRILYLVDSVAGTIFRFAFDLDEGRISGQAILCEFPSAAGLPDGLAVDVEGCLWVAFHGGGCLRRIAPDGRVLLEIPLPVTQPTSCAFGAGTDLFVTTAREGLTARDVAAQPTAGSVFVLDVSVEGVPVGVCRL